MIKIKNIVKNYKVSDAEIKVLKDISINFRENEFVSILGPSGCGKTTLLNVLGGLDRYNSGDLIVNEKSTKDYADKDWDTYRSHYVGFIFQTYNLIMHLSVLENVEIALTIAGLSKVEKRKRAVDALSKVGLSDQIKKRPNQLSGGQMQRVAIARAIVNNPAIILADEPTGALDSETSIQIMEILKAISKDHLIIMVTHNGELAKQYSTRIIKLLDGVVIGDNNPFAEPKTADNKIAEESLKSTDQNDNNKNISFKKKRSSMNFLTALNLSFKNLLTKKGRTFMTSFAGSIGIIGIALVLAISNGFNGYISKMQSDTLSGYPIAISTIAVDTSTLKDFNMGGNDKEEFPDDKFITVKDPTADYVNFSHYNFLSPQFVNYVKEYEAKDNGKTLNNVSYSYASALNILTKSNNEVVEVKTDLSNNVVSGSFTSSFYEGLSGEDFVTSQYEVLYGTYPKNKNEVALVIDSSNSLSKKLLNNLGIDYVLDGSTYLPIDFSDIAGENGKEYQVVLNNQFYNPVTENGVITDFTKTTEQNISGLYDNANNVKLKISAILRVKPTSPMSIYPSGIAYLPELTEYLNSIERNSDIAVQQKLQTSKLFVPYTIKVAEVGINQTFKTVQAMQAFVSSFYKVNLTNQQVYEYALQSIGASTIPTSIKLYPKDFDAKDSLTTYLNDWNNKQESKNNKIIFSDATKLLSDTMGNMVNIISYVLIAFAGISLVVSSIMIGIITYVSVLERTKEIGVLRSIGARKKDISRVFNAETFMVGLLAGTIGVFVSFVLTFPISAIIKHVAGSAVTTSLAVLNPVHALYLVVISTSLTLISGFIPSRFAAKKDPVKALRSE